MKHYEVVARRRKARNNRTRCPFSMINFANLFYYSAYFSYYLWISLHFFILFQLTFTFIYSTFNKKFSVSAK